MSDLLLMHLLLVLTSPSCPSSLVPPMSSNAPTVPKNNVAKKRKKRATSYSDDDFADPQARLTKPSKPATRKSKRVKSVYLMNTYLMTVMTTIVYILLSYTLVVFYQVRLCLRNLILVLILFFHQGITNGRKRICPNYKCAPKQVVSGRSLLAGSSPRAGGVGPRGLRFRSPSRAGIWSAAVALGRLLLLLPFRASLAPPWLCRNALLPPRW